MARAREGGGGLCLRPSGAWQPDRVLCPPSQGARARPTPRVRGAAGLWAPRQRGPPQSNPALSLSPRRLGHSGTCPRPGGPGGGWWVLVIPRALGVQGRGGRSVTVLVILESSKKPAGVSGEAGSSGPSRGPCRGKHPESQLRGGRAAEEGWARGPTLLGPKGRTYGGSSGREGDRF